LIIALASSRNSSPSLGLAIARYLPNCPLKDVVLDLTAAHMTAVTLASILFSLGVSSWYFLAALSEASAISYCIY
jgi:hypothetical protein